MATEPNDVIEDALTLRFEGKEKDGSAVHELRAAHVAEVLQGLVGLSSDFAKAGAFGDGPAGSEVLVRPAREGSFLMEVIRSVVDNQEAIATGAGVGGPPTLGQIIWWSTRSARASVKDYVPLEDGKVKIIWQDDTVDVVPKAVAEELMKRKPRRKRQLRQIMAPLSDPRVSSVEVESQPAAELEADGFTLTRPDYDAVRPEDEVEEQQYIFEAEAQMSAIDFVNRTKWRVTIQGETRTAKVEDEEFLGRVTNGLAIRNSDIFVLRVREDTVVKNGRTTRTWTVLKVDSYRRATHDDGS